MGQHARRRESLTFERFIMMGARGAALDRMVAWLARLVTPLTLLPPLRRQFVELRRRKEARLTAIREMRGVLAAMTPEERANPDLIDHARRSAIAQAAGCEPMFVSHLRRTFNSARRAQTQLSGGPATGR
jgi:signal recognition particle GTPase